MRRRLPIAALLLAWLFANGAVWNVVQVVGWSQMFATNLTYLSVGKALVKTFDGSQPCKLCVLTQTAQDAAKKQSPTETTLGGGFEKILLLADSAPALVLSAPDFAWPGVVHDSGLTRTDPVPVTPPRV